MKGDVCAYCGKKIGAKDYYGILGSGLLTHDKCYKKAFTDKTWKARKFRIKNWVLYNWDKFKFSIWYVFFMR